jgi:hypothetical protein
VPSPCSLDVSIAGFSKLWCRHRGLRCRRQV